jgi:hypothetical protein
VVAPADRGMCRIQTLSWTTKANLHACARLWTCCWSVPTASCRPIPVTAVPFVRDAKDLRPLTKEPDWQHKLNAVALTVLLYLAGDPDIVRIVHPGQKPLIKPAFKSAIRIATRICVNHRSTRSANLSPEPSNAGRLSTRGTPAMRAATARDHTCDRRMPIFTGRARDAKCHACAFYCQFR